MGCSMRAAAACVAVLVVACCISTADAQNCTVNTNINACQLNANLQSGGTRGCMVASSATFTPTCTSGASAAANIALTSLNSITAATGESCSSPDDTVTLNNLRFQGTMTAASGQLYNLGFWVSANGIAPNNAAASCHALAQPVVTSGTNAACYFTSPGGTTDQCGDVTRCVVRDVCCYATGMTMVVSFSVLWRTLLLSSELGLCY